MGALLSQAVANQLRQYPGFQNPNPTPQTLLQQVLNPPGPSLPMWQAPVMENQQLAAVNTPQANRAFAQDMLRAALAFGGADITKEQKAAWEAENRAYRHSRLSQLGNPPRPEGYEPGTRVAMRPWGVRTQNPASVFGPGKLAVPNEGDMAGGTGVIVIPGTPEAGEPAHKSMPEFATRVAKGMEPGPVRAGPLRGGAKPVGDQPPGPDYVAVRGEQSGHWFWRHRDSLEVLPPLEKFRDADMVTYESGGVRFEGSISNPPPGAGPSPGPDYVWADMYEPATAQGRRHASMVKGYHPYQYGTFGGWFPRSDLTKVKIGKK